MAREPEMNALEWACRIYCAEAEYLRKTEMHDNYTDRARSRARQTKALEIMRQALAMVDIGDEEKAVNDDADLIERMQKALQQFANADNWECHFYSPYCWRGDDPIALASDAWGARRDDDLR